MSTVPNDTEITMTAAEANHLLALARANTVAPDAATSSALIECVEKITGTKATSSSATATPQGSSSEASAIRAQTSQSQVNTAVSRCKEALKAKNITEIDLLHGSKDVAPFSDTVSAISQVAIELNLSSAQTKDLFVRLFPSSSDTLKAIATDQFAVGKTTPFWPPAAGALAERINCTPTALSEPTSGMKLLTFVNKVKSDMQLIYGPTWATSPESVKTFNLHMLPYIHLTSDIPRYMGLIRKCKSPTELDTLIRENEWTIRTASGGDRSKGGKRNKDGKSPKTAAPATDAQAKSNEQPKPP